MLPALDVDLARLERERPPAVLLGGLDLLRPLGFAGVPAIVASPDPGEPALRSRYCGGRLLLPAAEDEAAEALLAAGERLAAALGAPAPLLPGSDEALALLAATRGRLPGRYAALLNEAPLAEALLDRRAFAELAARLRLPVPRSLDWCELGRWEAPVLVRPRRRAGRARSPALERLLGAGEARRFERGREVLASAAAYQLRDLLVFQEPPPGDERERWSFHGVADERGELLAGFAGRRLRRFLELAHDPGLEALGRDVAARLGLRGAFRIDLGRGPSSGRCAVLEVDARFGPWHHAAARHGVNLPRVAYEYLSLGERPSAQRRWRRRVRCRAYELHSWSDPRPFAGWLAGEASARARRSAARLRSQIEQWLSTAS